MKRHVLMGALAALTLTISATAAQAATISLDFTADLYAGANNAGDFVTVDQGVTVKLSSTILADTQSFSGKLSQTSSGLGAKGLASFLSSDEISCFGGKCETVVAGFDQSQFVHSIAFANLFDIPGGEHEAGRYNINNTGWIPFFANSPTGFLTLIIDQDNVNSIAFATSSSDLRGAHDFAVNSITIGEPIANAAASEVPEPATMILLGTGLLAAAAQRRRKKN